MDFLSQEEIMKMPLADILQCIKIQRSDVTLTDQEEIIKQQAEGLRRHVQMFIETDRARRQAEELVEKLKLALEFYANPSTYEQTRASGVKPIWTDKGHLARETLEDMEEL